MSATATPADSRPGVATEAIEVGGIIVVILVLGSLGVAATWWMPEADALAGAPR